MDARAGPVHVATDAAPPAVGAYSQAVLAGGLVFCSGQIGLHPATRELVAGGIAAETERVLGNLSAVLEAAGSQPSKVTKATIYLADMQDFAVVDEIYARWLGAARPARATVAVASLPKGARVEIDAIAMVG